MEVLAPILLPVRDNGFGFPELIYQNDELAPFDLLDLTGQKLPHLICKLVSNSRAFAFAYSLNDALFRGLHGRPPKRVKRYFLLENFTDLEILILPPCLFQTDLRGTILHRLNDCPQHHHLYDAFDLVDSDFRIDRRAVSTHQGCVDTIPQQVDQLVPLELLGIGEFTKRCKHFGWCRHLCSSRSHLVPIDSQSGVPDVLQRDGHIIRRPFGP